MFLISKVPGRLGFGAYGGQVVGEGLTVECHTNIKSWKENSGRFEIGRKWGGEQINGKPNEKWVI